MKNIFVTRDMVDAGLKFLQDKGLEVEVYPGKGPMPYQELKTKAREFKILITMLNDKIDREFLLENPQLKMIANNAVGFNNIDLITASELGIKVSNTPDVLTEATAEVAVGLTLSVLRNFKEGISDIDHNRFQSFDPKGYLGTSLFHKTVGIVGMGRIGQKTAEVFKNGFNCKILYTSNTSESSLGTKVTLEELLKNSDVVSLHVPMREENRNLISKKELEKMKSTAIIINTARGEVINQMDLVWALKNKIIAGAGLDVTSPEPLPTNHELLTLKNCTILPHVGSANKETRAEMSMLCAYNILDFLEGKNPRNCLN